MKDIVKISLYIGFQCLSMYVHNKTWLLHMLECLVISNRWPSVIKNMKHVCWGWDTSKYLERKSF